MLDISDLVKRLAEFKIEAMKQRGNGPARKEQAGKIVCLRQGRVIRIVSSGANGQIKVRGIEDDTIAVPETKETA
jgi:hypothetical protein